MDSPQPNLHLSGPVLLGPDDARDQAWVVGGRLTFDAPIGADAVTVEGFVLPGLVDAHCHIGIQEQGAVPRQVQEEQASADRDAGALLVRDAGSASDTRWMDDRDDLPRIIRAGRHIARPKQYFRTWAAEVEPEELTAEVERQVGRGDGWVKLVGDWIDRAGGDLAPCWPRAALDQAIVRAHELGARVTAHVFGEDALPDLLGAGIDCIEHGSGLSPDMLDLMVQHGTALVPTRMQLENFPIFAAAGEARFPRYAAHMRALHARVDHTLGAAYEAGVPIYCGTDAGGLVAHGLVAQEVLALHDHVGLSRADALGAATWKARSWLRRPGLDEGASADLAVFATDPRADLAVLSAPDRIVLRGRIIR